VPVGSFSLTACLPVPGRDGVELADDLLESGSAFAGPAVQLKDGCFLLVAAGVVVEVPGDVEVAVTDRLDADVGLELPAVDSGGLVAEALLQERHDKAGLPGCVGLGWSADAGAQVLLICSFWMPGTHKTEQ
jgi:hypothetical protein